METLLSSQAMQKQAEGQTSALRGPGSVAVHGQVKAQMKTRGGESPGDQPVPQAGRQGADR